MASLETRPPLRFGAFLPPYHLVGQSPSLALERDLELMEHLDRLGFDEAWIGEHHSGGLELIASPELFIATAAQRTRQLRFGTGVVSLPYHHPLIVADRMLLLDHLTRGRCMLGVGPGGLTSDAFMMGIDPEEQRRMMAESLEAVMALLRGGEPVTRKADWFELNEARLQLASYTHPHLEVAVAATVSPSGPRLVGRHGTGMLSLAATSPAGFEVLGRHWDIALEQASLHGQRVERGAWRLVCPMHVAATRARAREEAGAGMVAVYEYLRSIANMPPSEVDGLEAKIDELLDQGISLLGTAEDAIAQIERMWMQSGGFGCVLLMAADFADREATLRSFEIIAREVMPHFKGQLAPVQRAYDWIHSERPGDGPTRWSDANRRAVERAERDYARERSGVGEDTPRGESGEDTPRGELGEDTPRGELGEDTPRGELGEDTPRPVSEGLADSGSDTRSS